ncbi:MAG: hypothetical protein AAFY98_01470 [Verrucomicrobiota bacterium]
MKGVISNSSDIKLIDIVQMLCQNSATACVKLETKNASSPTLINILNGELLNVISDELSDREAMVDALLAAYWDFEVLPQLLSNEKRIQETTAAFLMGSTIEYDMRRSKPGHNITQEVPYPDLEDRINSKMSSKRGDLVLLPHFGESMGNSLGLGELQFILFEEDQEMVTLVKEESRVVRHIYADTELGDVIKLFKSNQGQASDE